MQGFETQLNYFRLPFVARNENEKGKGESHARARRERGKRCSSHFPRASLALRVRSLSLSRAQLSPRSRTYVCLLPGVPEKCDS